MMNLHTFDPIAHSYWKGETVKGKIVKTRIGELRPISNIEILFNGTLIPSNWSLHNSELTVIESLSSDAFD